MPIQEVAGPALTVRLQGYPEAVLAEDSIVVPREGKMRGTDVITHVGGLDARLAEALLHKDGTPRQSTRLVVRGRVQEHDQSFGAEDEVTLLAALPCDG